MQNLALLPHLPSFFKGPSPNKSPIIGSKYFNGKFLDLIEKGIKQYIILKILRSYEYNKYKKINKILI